MNPKSPSLVLHLRFSIILAIFCFNLNPVVAQQDSTLLDTLLPSTPPPPLPELYSPRQTVAHHLIYLQDGEFDKSRSAQALDSTGVSQEELEELAVQLKQIYDGEAFFIDTAQIPNDPNYEDSLGRNRFPVFAKYPEIYVTKHDGSWKYSRNTVWHIPQVHDKVFPFGSDLLVNISPQIGQKKVLGLRIWQYQGILIILVLAALSYWLLTRLFGILIRKVLPRVINTEWLDPKLIRPVARPLSLLLTLWLLFQFFPALLLPIGVSSYIAVGLKILMSIFGIVAAYRLVDLFSSLFLNLAGTTETTMDDQLIPLVSKLAKLIVGALGVLFVLQNLNVNVTALLAGISIGGLALALAAQETVKNFIGSITIFVDRPFQVGDFIESPQITGSVQEIGVRSTRIRAIDGALMSIPNGTLANLVITNHGIRSYRRYSTTLGLTYDTPKEKMETFVERAREIIVAHPMTRKEDNMVYFHEMGASSLDIFVVIYFEITAYADMLKGRQEIFLAIMEMAEEIGVGFAFPSTSVYIEQIPESITPKR